MSALKEAARAREMPEKVADDSPEMGRRAGFCRRFLRHRPAVAGLLFVLIMGVAALLAPWLSPYNPYKMDLANVSRPPSLHNLLGTDKLGRDTLTRILYGGRVSISVAVASVVISTTMGVALGAVAGYRRGHIDSLIMRAADVFMAFPLVLLLIVMIPILGPSPVNVVVLLGCFNWMGVARLVRGQVMTVMNDPYVEAAVAGGASGWRIIFRHALPNAIAPIVVASTLGVANAMLVEAALSFLGLGIQPPVPSWGNMLQQAQQLQVLVQQPWAWMGPGAAIALTVLSINFMGDGVRDALDPRHQAKV